MKAWARLGRRYPEDVEGVLPQRWIEEFDLYFQLDSVPPEKLQ